MEVSLTSGVGNMEITKRSIVEQVLKLMNFEARVGLIKVAVLGASDKRYILIHQRVFENTVQREKHMNTLDIDVDHLGGVTNGVVWYDVTKPFPSVPYGIVFSHELMKFLTPEEQLQTIENSYYALTQNGLAMHILHEPSIKGTSELRV